MVGFTYLLTQAVSVFLGRRGAFYLCLGCLLAGMFALCLRAQRRETLLVLPVAFLTAAVASGAFFAASAPFDAAARSNDGRTMQLTGVVREQPASDSGKARYIVQVESCTGDSSLEGFCVQLSAGETFAASQFDRVQGTVKLYLPPGDGFFSKRSQLLSDRVVLQGFLNEYLPYTVEAAEIPLWRQVPYRIRTALQEAIDSHIGTPQSALASGILLGGSDGIPEDVKTAFRDAGVYHLLSVSGLHMATVAQCMVLLLSLLPIPRRLRYAAAFAGIVLFMGVAGFVPAVVRSGLMYLLLLAGHFFSRRADSLNSLGLATLALCAASPYAAADVGLLLSFSATLGILLCAPRFTRFLQRHGPRARVLNRLAAAACGVVATSLAAALFTLPVCLLVFDTVSLISPLTNLLVLLPSTWMIYALLLAACFTALPIAPLATCGWWAADALAQGLIAIARWCAGLPLAAAVTDYRFVPLWLACAMLTLGCAFLIGWRSGKPPLRTASALCTILLLVNILGYEVDARDKCRITVAASGEGVSAVLSYNGHSAVIGCGAGSWQVDRILRRVNTQSLDAVLLLTQNTAESQAAAELLPAWHPQQLVLPADLVLDAYLEQALVQAGRVQVCGTTAQTSLWEQRALLTYADGSALLSVGGVSVLFSGEKADLDGAPAAFQDADILVCAALPAHPGRLSPGLTCLCAYPNSLKTYDRARFGAPVVLGNAEDLVLEPQTSGQLEIRRND